MSAPEMRRPRRGDGADADTKTYRQPESYDIPAHRLHPAEADLRLVTNATRRERHHWWLLTEEGRHQRALLELLGWWAA